MFCPQKRPGNNDQLHNYKHLQTVVSMYHFPLKGISSEKEWLITCLEQEMNKMSLKHLIPEYKADIKVHGGKDHVKRTQKTT